MAEAFRARALDTTHSSFVFEITGAPAKIDSFIDLMRPLGLVDVSRTGVAAISRGRRRCTQLSGHADQASIVTLPSPGASG